MGGALLEQWAKDTDTQFTVADPMATSVPDGVQLVKGAGDLDQTQFDIVIIAVKPQLINKVVPDYLSALKTDALTVSIAAGYTMERLAELVRSDRIMRVMPNLPSMIGQGVAGLCATDAVDKSQRETVERLMQCAGETIWVDDDDAIDRLTAVSGSGPGYLFEMLRAYVEAGVGMGFTEEQSKTLTFGTFSGTLAMAMDSDLSLEQLRNNVTSKGGTTAAGLGALNSNGEFTALAKKTMQAAYDRAVEMRAEK